MHITVDRNYIELLDHKIDRPSAIAPGQWLEFWQRADGGHQKAIDITNRGGVVKE